jgi:hypothetical protein
MKIYHLTTYCPYGFEGCKESICKEETCEMLKEYLRNKK